MPKPELRKCPGLISFNPETGEQQEPGAIDQHLYAIHIEECERNGAEMYNCGWSEDEDDETFELCSKTSKGILSTLLDKQTLEAIHTWDTHVE